MHLLSDLPYAVIQRNAEINAIELIFKRKSGIEDFIETNNTLLEEFKKLNVNRFLVDPTKMGVVSTEGQHYVATRLLPEMIRHLNGKNLYHAQVLPQEDVFAKYAAQNIKQKSSQQLPHLFIAQFGNINEARQWLAEQS